MLDRLPAWLRHLIIALGPVILAWIASDIIPALQGKQGVAGVLAALLGLLVAVATPWFTTQYGVGSGRE